MQGRAPKTLDGRMADAMNEKGKEALQPHRSIQDNKLCWRHWRQAFVGVVSCRIGCGHFYHVYNNFAVRLWIVSDEGSSLGSIRKLKEMRRTEIKGRYPALGRRPKVK